MGQLPWTTERRPLARAQAARVQHLSPSLYVSAATVGLGIDSPLFDFDNIF